MLTVAECQSVELEIMEKIHQYCVKHNLRYLMLYGTLIGAVRHHGFIPWDNDMDIGMPRKDFERFLELTRTEPVAEHLYVEHYTTDSRYHYMCIRVCDDRTHVHVPYIREQPRRMGLWVDIFVMDGVCPNRLPYRLQKLEIRFYWLLFRTYVYGTYDNKNQFRKLVKQFFLLFLRDNRNRLNERITRLASRYSFEDCELVANVFTPQYCPLRREDFNRPLLMPFEKYSFYAPEHYDEYLTLCFGDYMRLPPENERVPHDLMAEWTVDDRGNVLESGK